MNREPDVHAAGRQPTRAAAAAFVGTTIEWYDFYIYATASALIFGKLFRRRLHHVAQVGILAG